MWIQKFRKNQDKKFSKLNTNLIRFNCKLENYTIYKENSIIRTIF